VNSGLRMSIVPRSGASIQRNSEQEQTRTTGEDVADAARGGPIVLLQRGTVAGRFEQQQTRYFGRRP